MKNFTSPMLLCDFYKLSHRNMYPKGTEHIYSTWTPRMSRIPGIDKVVVFGIQQFVKKYLIEYFNEYFFNEDIEKIKTEYKRIVKYSLGVEDPETMHIEDLHELGYLPIKIKAIDEGNSVPIRVPFMTIENTHPKFFWLTNYIESLASCELWQASTSATISKKFKEILVNYAKETGSEEFVPFQGHDFSFRGMSSLDSSISSGMGHLLSFAGTDTIPAIQALEYYYGANVETEMVGCSVPATEHSVQCSFCDDEKYIEEIITKVHPTGIVSVVSDGYDFWHVMTNILPSLKDKIMARDGKTVIRPDSGDVVDIICGAMSKRGMEKSSKTSFTPEEKGAIQVLYEVFGGSVNSKGFIELDPHIGLIYGDSITLSVCERICERLKEKGFASTNVVLGIGSYTYQMNTRDTFGFALKSTSCIINGKEQAIFKDPKTDTGVKKSQKGRVCVFKKGIDYYYMDEFTKLDEVENELTTVFENGILLKELKFSEIKNNIIK